MPELGCYLGPYLPGPNNTVEFGIYCGNAQVLSRYIPDNSVSLIFTDPPYPYDFIDCYSALSGIAARVLKERGLLMCYGGQSFMPEVLARLGEHLSYRWTIAVLHGASQIVWGRRMVAAWKPLYVFSKGGVRAKDRVLYDVVPPSHRDKRWHAWGQSEYEAVKYIEECTESGDVVFDPFCGGGTVPAACRILGRRYLAFEIDCSTCEVARKRVYEMQLPLPISMTQQPALIPEVLTCVS